MSGWGATWVGGLPSTLGAANGRLPLARTCPLPGSFFYRRGWVGIHPMSEKEADR
jgi:hypothetical protein